MSDKKVIVVFGATGAQGGSVVSALLEDGTFAVRAVTRDPTKPAAVKLKEAGAEVVAADLDDEKSLEVALNGTYGTFVVTNYWEHMDKDKEVAQGKRIADVTKRLDLKLVVFSGLESVKKLTNGKLEVKEFDGKAEIEDYFWEIGVPMTSVRLPCYYENLLTFFRPQKDKDGDGYTLPIPLADIAMDGFSVKDLGGVVLSIFLSPSKYITKVIGLSTEKLTVDEYAAIMSKVLGKTIKNAKMSAEDYEKLDFREAQEIADIFRFYTQNPDRNIELTFQLYPKAKKFQEWVEANKAGFENL